DPLRREVVAEQAELALRGYLRPVQYRDAWRRALAAPGMIGLEQHVERVRARGQRAHVPIALEASHRRKGQEDLGERIVVGRTRGRLGVVLGDGDAAATGEERVDA